MQALERVRVDGCRKLRGRPRLVVCRPHTHREAVTNVGAGLHPGLKSSHRAAGVGETPNDLYFEFRAPGMRHGSDPDDDVAWHQAQDETVRVVKNNRVVGRQVER
jgi:hypothetical protein